MSGENSQRKGFFSKIGNALKKVTRPPTESISSVIIETLFGEAQIFGDPIEVTNLRVMNKQSLNLFIACCIEDAALNGVYMKYINSDKVDEDNPPYLMKGDPRLVKCRQLINNQTVYNYELFFEWFEENIKGVNKLYIVKYNGPEIGKIETLSAMIKTPDTRSNVDKKNFVGEFIETRVTNKTIIVENEAENLVIQNSFMEGKDNWYNQIPRRYTGVGKVGYGIIFDTELYKRDNVPLRETNPETKKVTMYHIDYYNEHKPKLNARFGTMANTKQLSLNENGHQGGSKAASRSRRSKAARTVRKSLRRKRRRRSSKASGNG